MVNWICSGEGKMQVVKVKLVSLIIRVLQDSTGLFYFYFACKSLRSLLLLIINHAKDKSKKEVEHAGNESKITLHCSATSRAALHFLPGAKNEVLSSDYGLSVLTLCYGVYL